MSSDLPLLVEKLSQPPFGFEESIVTLSNRIQAGPSSVHQLLTDAFSAISPDTHPLIDVKAEALDQTVARLSNFLRHIKYRPEEDELTFREGLANGDTEIVLPILRALVQNPKQLGKRAFVGYYLSDDVRLPEDIAQDEEMLQIKEQLRELQDEFVRLHRAKEQTRGAKDPALLRAKIPELETEKSQLRDKIEKTSAKVQGVEGLDKMLKLASALRHEQDMEVQLGQSLQQQKQHLQISESRYQKTVTRLRELQSTATSSSSAALIKQLEDDTAASRVAVRERLPKEIEAKKAKLASINDVLGSGIMSESDLHSLTAHRERIQGEVSGLVDRRNELKQQLGERMGQQLRQQMQMANVISRKREDMAAKVERLALKKRDLTAEYNEKASTNEEGEAGGIELQSEEMRKKMESVKEKLVLYKQKKKVLEAQRAESLTLQHTAEILLAQRHESLGILQDAEREDGVAGATNTLNNLEKMSLAKNEVDVSKGEALEEISRVVMQINATIKEKKAFLAPKIKQLRTLRQVHQSVEEEHKDKWQEYQRSLMSHESRRARLDEEVGGYQSELARDEGKFHILNCNAAVLDVTVQRATQVSETARLKQRYEKVIASQEDSARELKVLQKEAKETAEPNKEQAIVLQDLKRLVQCKLDIYSRGNVGTVTHIPTSDAGTANVMTF